MTYIDCIAGDDSPLKCPPPPELPQTPRLRGFFLSNSFGNELYRDGVISNDIMFNEPVHFAYGYEYADLIEGTGTISQDGVRIASNLTASIMEIVPVQPIERNLVKGDRINFTLSFFDINGTELTANYTIRIPAAENFGYYTILNTLPDFNADPFILDVSTWDDFSVINEDSANLVESNFNKGTYFIITSPVPLTSISSLGVDFLPRFTSEFLVSSNSIYYLQNNSGESGTVQYFVNF